MSGLIDFDIFGRESYAVPAGDMAGAAMIAQGDTEDEQAGYDFLNKIFDTGLGYLEYELYGKDRMITQADLANRNDPADPTINDNKTNKPITPFDVGIGSALRTPSFIIPTVLTLVALGYVGYKVARG